MKQIRKIAMMLAAVLVSISGARADEGMWFLTLMQQQHLADSLKAAGLEMPAEGIYSETSPSLRECVGIFGGGCTGEVVSAEGLVLTNHHCGFAFVHEMSSIGNDIMKDGYFAHSRSEELRTPESLTFTFVLRVADVTKEVDAAAKEQGVDEYRKQTQSFLMPLANEMLKKSDFKKKKGVEAHILPYFGGNQYYILYTQEYLDVRLVANPPYNIGQFGGNSDNWMWPRQNADFAMFRIYADKNGDPAPYSEKNVPLKVKKYLPISLKGMDKGDYTMTMGFPGTTMRYLTASEVKLRCESYNAPIVLAGNPLLAYYKNLMDQSDEMRLLLEDEYFSWGNMVKNFGGMIEAVEKNGLIAQKKAEEEQFRAFAKKSGKPEYQHIIESIDSLCADYADAYYDISLFEVALGNQALQPRMQYVDRYVAAVKGGDTKAIETARAKLMNETLDKLHSVNLDVDKGLVKLLTPYYVKYHKLPTVPSYLEEGKDWEGLIDRIYSQSLFTDSARMAKALEAADTAALLADPLYEQYNSLNDFRQNIVMPAAVKYSPQRKAQDKIYVRGLCDMYNWQKAPDANFTLRLSYGHVNDLKPRDAVSYDWRTVLDGMFEKESATESDYFVNPRLRELFEKGDFGCYAREDGKLPACFLSDNDITGGNSGSPVMNARGELIGLAFDGNIESLSSDLKYDSRLQRCINVDIRLVLFIIDKYGDCKYVFDELDIRE